MKNGKENTSTTSVPQEDNGHTQHASGHKTEKEVWTRERVEKFSRQDLQAAISFLMIINDNPDIMDMIVDELLIMTQKREKENLTPVE